MRSFLGVSAVVGIVEENRDFEIAWAVRINAAVALVRMGDDSGIATLAELHGASQAILRSYAGRLLDDLAKQRENTKRQD